MAYQRLVQNAGDKSWDSDFRTALATCLNCVASRLVFQNCTLSRWNASRGTIEGAFGKQALQNTWDFTESNPTSDGPASWSGSIVWVVKVIEANLQLEGEATVIQSSAQEQVLPNGAAQAIITDPPYFASIPYGDLSDVFYVWEREFIRVYFPSLYVKGLTDKADEAIVSNATLDRKGRPKSPEFYREEMTRALQSARCIISPDGIAVIVFADSRTESWEAILGAMIAAGWQITGSWPLDTELQSRTQATNSASLQSSIHVVCRPRESMNGMQQRNIGEWRDVLGELPTRIHQWMPRLAQEGVVGADAIFSCLGPALEIFSRYSVVEKASGEPATLGEYLEQVWAAVSTEALSMIFEDADAAGLEPDARLTAMWLWTLGGGKPAKSGKGKSGEPEETENEGGDDEEASVPAAKTTGYSLEYDAARKIAQGLGIHLEKNESIVQVKGETARLLPVSERTSHLFGKSGENGTVTQGKTGKKAKKSAQQPKLFGELIEAEATEAGWTDLKGPAPGTTVLDRLHQTMILFAAGRGELMKRFLLDDGVGTDARFWKLAQSLSALYPTGTDEKRWVDGVLARKKGLGL